jgi:phage-related protein
MSQPPILTLTPEWDIQEKRKFEVLSTPLGDGYKQVALGGMNASTVSWEVSRTGLTTSQLSALVDELSLYTGVTGFQWQPDSSVSYRVYTCEKWQTNELGKNIWRISATFEEDVSGQCVALLDLIDEVELNGWLTGANTFLATYTKNTLPLMLNTVGGAAYLSVNSFHDVLGRGGYFPGSAGTSEGQALGIRACLKVWKATGVTAWKQRAIDMARSLEPVLYGGQTVPTNTTDLWVPHWLYNVKSAFTAKGKTATDPLAFGYFDVLVNFTNGVGQVGTGSPNDGDKLSDVFSVYAVSAKLLWQNVYSPVVFGQTYSINYWVSNFMLGGSNFRIFPTTAASNGTAPVSTTETPGKIVLNSSFTGQLKVTYAAYTGGTVGVNQNFDAYPMWRQLLTNEINCAFDAIWWIAEAFELLFEVTGDTKWQRALQCTVYNTAQTSIVQNPTHWYKPESNSDPFSYPGTQVIQVNNSNGFTATRETGASLLNALKIQVAAAPAGSFPSVEVQNFAVQAQIVDDTTIRASVAQSVTVPLQVALSTSTDAFDLTKTYFVNWLVSNGSSAFTTRTFLPEDFFLWNSTLVWHFAIADNPLYGFSGGGGSHSLGRNQDSITYKTKALSQCVSTATMNASTGYAGAGAVLIGKQIRRPPRIAFRNSQPVAVKIRDGSGVTWSCEVTTATSIRVRQFEWSDFQGSGSPDTENDIQAVEFHAISGNGSTSLGVWWIAENERKEPEQIPYPCVTYKGLIASKARTAYTLWVGIFKPINSPSDALKYNPGVVPFTVNILNGAIDAWRGVPFTAYQDPHFWRKWGYQDRAQQVLDFFRESQNAYAQSTGVTGGFAPVFKWGYWDSSDFFGSLNSFGWDGADPNSRWGQYGHRALEVAAKYWESDRSNTQAREITMKYLNMVDRLYLQNNTNMAITDFPQGSPPQTNYHDPGASALIGRAAVYANLAGGSPSVTFRVINRCLAHLRSQYVSSGTMLGSFSAGQPTFVSGGTTFSEWFFFWEMEIAEFVALLLEKRNLLTLPPCGASL